MFWCSLGDLYWDQIIFHRSFLVLQDANDFSAQHPLTFLSSHGQCLRNYRSQIDCKSKFLLLNSNCFPSCSLSTKNLMCICFSADLGESLLCEHVHSFMVLSSSSSNWVKGISEKGIQEVTEYLPKSVIPGIKAIYSIIALLPLHDSHEWEGRKTDSIYLFFSSLGEGWVKWLKPRDGRKFSQHRDHFCTNPKSHENS